MASRWQCWAPPGASDSRPGCTESSPATTPALTVVRRLPQTGLPMGGGVCLMSPHKGGSRHKCSSEHQGLQPSGVGVPIPPPSLWSGVWVMKLVSTATSRIPGRALPPLDGRRCLAPWKSSLLQPARSWSLVTLRWAPKNWGLGSPGPGVGGRTRRREPDALRGMKNTSHLQRVPLKLLNMPATPPGGVECPPTPGSPPDHTIRASSTAQCIQGQVPGKDGVAGTLTATGTPHPSPPSISPRATEARWKPPARHWL